MIVANKRTLWGAIGFGVGVLIGKLISDVAQANRDDELLNSGIEMGRAMALADGEPQEIKPGEPEKPAETKEPAAKPKVEVKTRKSA